MRNKKIFNKIHRVSVSLVFIALLFPLKVGSFFVVLFILTSIFKLIFFNSRNKIRKPNSFVFLFSGIYFLYLIGVLYTENIKTAQQLLERNITWLLIPFLMFYTIYNNKKELLKLLLTFAITTQFFATVFLLIAVYRFFSGEIIDVFYYTELTSFTKFHPIYFAVYVFFSLIIFFYGFKKRFFKKPIFYFIVFFNTLILILLSSKTVLFFYIIFALYNTIKYLKRHNKLIFLPILILIFSSIVFNFSVTKNRIKDTFFSNWNLLQKEQFLYNDNFTGATLRLVTWKFVVKKMISKNIYLTGVGTGDGQDFINIVYKEHNMDKAGYMGYNMHNQFLEYFVRFGLIGLFYFIIILFICFKKAIKNKDYLYLWFLLIFTIVSVTESTLEIQRGIVFFLLFNFLLYFNSTPVKKLFIK